MGSCSAKPCSFSPLKPDYSGGACACVCACLGGEEEEFHNKCLQPRWAQLPQSCPRDGGITPPPGNGAEGGLSPSLLSPCLRRSGRAPAVGVRAGRAGAWEEVSTGAWRWTLWLPVGFEGRCCGSSWGLGVDAAAPYGVWRWTSWLPMGFGGGRSRDSEVGAAALGGVWRWTLWLPVGPGGGCCSSPCGFLPLPSTGVQCCLGDQGPGGGGGGGGG